MRGVREAPKREIEAGRGGKQCSSNVLRSFEALWDDGFLKVVTLWTKQ